MTCGLFLISFPAKKVIEKYLSNSVIDNIFYATANSAVTQGYERIIKNVNKWILAGAHHPRVQTLGLVAKDLLLLLAIITSIVACSRVEITLCYVNKWSKLVWGRSLHHGNQNLNIFLTSWCYSYLRIILSELGKTEICAPTNDNIMWDSFFLLFVQFTFKVLHQEL